MSSEIRNNMCFFAGRTDTPPVPQFPDNPKQIWRAFSMLQLAPPETRNMRIMEIHYKDRTKAYDSWFWQPSVRRIGAVLPASARIPRAAAITAPLTTLDGTARSALIPTNILGTKEYFMARHNDPKSLSTSRANASLTARSGSALKSMSIEAVNKEPNFSIPK